MTKCGTVAIEFDPSVIDQSAVSFRDFIAKSVKQ